LNQCQFKMNGRLMGFEYQYPSGNINTQSTQRRGELENRARRSIPLRRRRSEGSQLQSGGRVNGVKKRALYHRYGNTGLRQLRGFRSTGARRSTRRTGCLASLIDFINQRATNFKLVERVERSQTRSLAGVRHEIGEHETRTNAARRK
jgi:hypothetical protein